MYLKPAPVPEELSLLRLFWEPLQGSTPAVGKPDRFMRIEDQAWDAPINDLVGLFPARIPHPEGALSDFVIVDKHRLLTEFVLKIAVITLANVAINTRRSAAAFGVMVTYAKNELIVVVSSHGFYPYSPLQS